jgi:type II secretion system (T2SS) protein C
MIISLLLGTVILTDVTQVAARISAGPGGSIPRDPAASAPMSSGRLLVLTGTIAYTDPRQGFAIIGSSVDDTHLARPGDPLPDGSSIREIYPKHVVLEYGGRLEIVGLHGRGELAGAAQIQTPALPQPVGLEQVDLKGVTVGDAILSQALRPTDELRIDPLPSDTRASETTGNERRSYHAQSTDAPQSPLPSAQDPADELSDDRRQRGASRGK